MNKLAFFDRDGTLNKEKEYLYRWEDFEWISEAKDLLFFLKEKGYILAVVTNQSGIARGYYSVEDVQKLHLELNKDLFKTHQIKIDHFEMCPHHPDFSGNCYCRKPGTEMFEKVLSQYQNVDLAQSIMIGDKDVDVRAGETVGVQSFLTLTGYGKTFADRVAEKKHIKTYVNFMENFETCLKL